MKYTFGPVNSRRFGLSLGIDLSPLNKSCNFDCLYCELKSAKPVADISNPPEVKEIVDEVKKVLLDEPNIEVITITSNGEPTLYADLDLLVDAINEIKENKKLLILSNSSTITDLNIQATLQKIDIVKLSLDCATQKCFEKIDRPLESITIKDIITGIKTFSRNFNNDLVIEILIVKDINDNKDQMQVLNSVLIDINPSRIDLGTIDRPPAYDVKPVTSEVLKELSTNFQGLPISIIHKDKPKIRIDFNEEEIAQMLKRRPQSQSDVDYLFSDNSRKLLDKLVLKQKVTEKVIAGVLFYCDTNRILSK